MGIRQVSRTGRRYEPGDWCLPEWWTSDPPVRRGHKVTTTEVRAFYDGDFVKNVLGHEGGITTLPTTTTGVNNREKTEPLHRL